MPKGGQIMKLLKSLILKPQTSDGKDATLQFINIVDTAILAEQKDPAKYGFDDVFDIVKVRHQTVFRASNDNFKVRVFAEDDKCELVIDVNIDDIEMEKAFISDDQEFSISIIIPARDVQSVSFYY